MGRMAWVAVGGGGWFRIWVGEPSRNHIVSNDWLAVVAAGSRVNIQSFMMERGGFAAMRCCRLHFSSQYFHCHYYPSFILSLYATLKQ